ncbi:MAG: cell division protein SepF [Firmicutes bacterium]|jgi:cell division inhibitor SepF|nr:cell division protein SepF [Bacillota bacterium]
MGFVSKMKELVGIEEIEEDEEEVEEEKKPIVPRQNAAPAPAPRTSSAAAPVPAAKAPQSGTRFTSAMKMVVIEPQGFDESPKLVDSLKAKKPVIINLENLETDTARKIFDFLSGATYALNGNVQKVANNIFVFAPENVSVDYKNEQKGAEKVSDGMRSPWR